MKEPNWDKMLQNILERIEQPLVYLIEEKQTGWFLADRPSRKYYLTKDPDLAMSFKGKDAKALANLFLFLNQEVGTLKSFIVTEHMFL